MLKDLIHAGLDDLGTRYLDRGKLSLRARVSPDPAQRKTLILRRNTQFPIRDHRSGAVPLDRREDAISKSRASGFEAAFHSHHRSIAAISASDQPK
ncbi:MAG: hypothetical protein R3D59_18725 [Paracoccaceae bacterium]